MVINHEENHLWQRIISTIMFARRRIEVTMQAHLLVFLWCLFAYVNTYLRSPSAQDPCWQPRCSPLCSRQSCPAVNPEELPKSSAPCKCRWARKSTQLSSLSPRFSTTGLAWLHPRLARPRSRLPSLEFTRWPAIKMWVFMSFRTVFFTQRMISTGVAAVWLLPGCRSPDGRPQCCIPSRGPRARS